MDSTQCQFAYTSRNPTDGNVGIGTLPLQYLHILENIASEYISIVPDKSVTTYHTYYHNLSGSLKLSFERIQHADFWKGVMFGAFEHHTSFASIMHNMPEMNEIYYSNPVPNFEKGPLYGAAANLIPHRDCILFYFPGIRVYRAIISATSGNHDTVTVFINHENERRLNKGDYMVFDFDRTLHQVKKTGQAPTPRILLKLHFLVCDMQYAKMRWAGIYVNFAYICYITYYKIARYTEQLGTDPKTFVGFFFGILWEYPFYPEIRHSAAGVYVGIVASLQKTHNVEVSFQNWREVVIYSTFDMIAIYLCIVLWFYCDYLCDIWNKKNPVEIYSSKRR